MIKGIGLKKIVLSILVFMFMGLFINANIVIASEKNIILENWASKNDSESTALSEERFYYPGDTGIVAMKNSFISTQVKSFSVTSSDSNIVSVEEKTGKYKVIAPGKAVITYQGKNSNGIVIFSAQYTMLVGADFTNVKLGQTDITSYMVGGEFLGVEIPLINCPQLNEYTSFSYTCSNDGLYATCELDKINRKINIKYASQGKTLITFIINNMTYVFNLTVYDVSINKISSVLAKKKTTKLKLNGYQGNITWKSTKKSVAKVSKKGTVTAKKVGNAVVYATIGNKRIGCAVSVVTAKLKKVVNKAKKIAKGTYSQPKRMQSGYYDCSSLVWKSYKTIKKYFGDKHYAPVAANIAKYLFSKKKRIKGGLSKKNISKMKLRPGDLMFETGAKNGRYKGIYHVEMFVGYQCEGFDSQGNPVLGTLWAARSPNYYYGNPMGRP